MEGQFKSGIVPRQVLSFLCHYLTLSLCCIQPLCFSILKLTDFSGRLKNEQQRLRPR